MSGTDAFLRTYHSLEGVVCFKVFKAEELGLDGVDPLAIRADQIKAVNDRITTDVPSLMMAHDDGKVNDEGAALIANLTVIFDKLEKLTAGAGSQSFYEDFMLMLKDRTSVDFTN